MPPNLDDVSPLFTINQFCVHHQPLAESKFSAQADVARLNPYTKRFVEFALPNQSVWRPNAAATLSTHSVWCGLWIQWSHRIDDTALYSPALIDANQSSPIANNRTFCSNIDVDRMKLSHHHQHHHRIVILWRICGKKKKNLSVDNTVECHLSFESVDQNHQPDDPRILFIISIT